MRIEAEASCITDDASVLLGDVNNCRMPHAMALQLEQRGMFVAESFSLRRSKRACGRLWQIS